MSLFFSAIANKKAGGGGGGGGAVGLIAVGSDFSFFISGSSGRAWGWGYNDLNELGDNSTTNRSTPVSVLGAVKTFCKISAGQTHGVALTNGGRAWSWGFNNSGQIGDNTLTQRATPVSVLGAVKTFCQINASAFYTLAIDKNGRAWGWGRNGGGQLGDNTIVSKLTPVSVLGAVKTFCQISAGVSDSLAIDKNGRAWGWGYNFAGGIGDNTTISKRTPVSVLGAVKTFCKISAGNTQYTSVAIDKNGRAWGWGYNSRGSIGDNSATNRLTPVSVLGAVKTFCKISTSGYHTAAIDKNGRVWCWGSNIGGTLGINSSVASILTPVSVLGAVKTFCEISVAGTFSVAIEKSGKVWCWGDNAITLGVNRNNVYLATPKNINGAVKTFCQITAHSYNSAGIDKNGRAWGWGRNQFGEVGNNTIVSEESPVSVLGTVKTFCKISSGDGHTMAIDKNGRAWGWGYNVTGQLGNNAILSRLTPVSVLGAVKTFCHIQAAFGGLFASAHSVAIDKNGRAWGWGDNFYGQLGNNSTLSRLTPVSVLGAVKTFCKITSHGPTVAAIDKNGRAWCWGSNINGQLGINSTLSRLTPVSVLGAVKTFCQIATGQSHTLAIDKNGRAWGWGYNTNGNLGDNTLISKLTPVSVLGAVKTFCKISGGRMHSVAIDKNGRAWGWGYNNRGQLGDNTVLNKSTPVAVAGALKTFCEITTGTEHTLAIDWLGKVWGWGTDTYGASGVALNSKTPVQICNL